ncbi:bifunctional DNA-formamidopyrimidine glycosylase/DNA-(apurinic or apyrimidinic site) lyase [Brachybacterium sp. GCM10030267]|uniref:bifunctional DNA-formamidopyrimidine glycosylase/DNA-(apurinic or apyrimidinic site) lyase n=1 Tax=Brachybacterium sp. GCM10030267 TaxID=3273381 RepID=UPI0036208CE9
MPELPEVEVVRRGLEPRTVGRVVDEVGVVDPRIIRRQSGGADRLAAALVGSRLTAVVRRGKFLWWRLADPDGQDTGEALMGHLGMSGQLRVRTPDPAPTALLPPSEGPAPDPLRHRRASLHLDDGTVIDMVDQRIFGGLWTSPLQPAADGAVAGLGSPDELLPDDAAGIARDLLDPAADLPAIARTLRSRRAPVKSLLLAQDVVSGIGNIYADEALWAARTRYDTPGNALTQRRALSILREAGAVMEQALGAGGTSFDALYVNVDGRSGYFARSLAAYGKDGEPCPRCGTLIRRAVHQARSSFYCPRCQRPLPRARKDQVR